MISSVEELSHCGTSPVFYESEGRKKMPPMTSIYSSHSAESATCVTFLTIIFSAPEAVRAKTRSKFSCEKTENSHSIRVRRSPNLHEFTEIFR